MSLSSRLQQILDDMEDHLSVLAAKHAVALISEVYEQIEECFEAMACCHLLCAAEVGKLQNHLSWAAMSRWHFLTRCAAEGHSDHRRARSRSNAVFCALAAGDLGLAVGVARLSPTAWMPSGEYEDDFAYHMVVHGLVVGPSEADVRRALASYEAALDGLPRERFDVLVALVDCDAAAFDGAFKALCDAHAALMMKEKSMHEDHPTVEPRAALFVEGLGILRLAERLGLVLPRLEYPMCPSLARTPLMSYQAEDLLSQL